MAPPHRSACAGVLSALVVHASSRPREAFVPYDAERFLSDPEVSKLLRSWARRYAQPKRDPAYSVEDVEHDLIARLLSRLPGYDPGRGSRTGFGLLIISHAIADLARARATQKRRHDAESLAPDQLDQLPNDHWGSGVSTRERQRDLSIDFRTAIANLPCELREVAQALLNGESVTSIARRLRRPPSTISARKARAFALLAKSGLAMYAQTHRQFPDEPGS
jgi:RNA polymerase sigma factor (sigma-70 family)